MSSLITDREGIYVDCTVGGGGHAEAILDRLGASGTVIGLDLDADAVEATRKRLARFRQNVSLFQADFSALGETLEENGISEVAGVLFDLGLSSLQLDAPDRGFSYSHDGPLDMRLNRSQSKTARDVVNWYTRNELTRIFRDYGQERYASTISRAVIRAREGRPIESTSHLAHLVQCAIPTRGPQVKTLSRIFQAIRIEVNDELCRLKKGLLNAIAVVRGGGRIVTISYHSLEDRIVKSIFSEKSKGCICPPDLPVCACDRAVELNVLTRGALRPDDEEVRRNNRARSARLRIAEKI
ncbi:MAG: 16S rRNA (cytosine(1402)-N(4))-methyltransferase RsmH [Gemmatimonadota bacterium]|nr:MAG: 16S rRNA (cytosine(1402)-N(4))-methyltransferase RsmH [Gemmatimonadota bacterium]